MQLRQDEIKTGLLVVGTVAVVAFVFILLGAPGLFRPLVTYRIYVDNAAGIKLGAPVMLAGRKIGQVAKLYSPVSREEEQRAEGSGQHLSSIAGSTATPSTSGNRTEIRSPNRRPSGQESHCLSRCSCPARCNWVCSVKWRSILLRVLRPGRARDGEIFAGERVPDFSEAAARMLEVIKPVAAEATSTMKELATTRKISAD